MVLMVLIYGMVQTVRWVMMDVSERRFDHDATLVQVAGAGDASGQVSPNFHHIRYMDTVRHDTCVPNCSANICGAPDGCGHGCMSGTCPQPGFTCQGGSCACTPNCAGQSCGASDGCGGLCTANTCAAGFACVAGNCICVPNCAGQSCGTPDGCGALCMGTCAFGTCVQGNCVCAPSCVSKNCGDSDGCGGKCSGYCPGNQTCQPDFTCSCVKTCTGQCALSDGCGGFCMGTCAGGQTCNKGSCTGDGYWSAWYPGACSVACGPGTETDTRYCLYPDPAHPGKDCSTLDGGNATRTVSCTAPACAAGQVCMAGTCNTLATIVISCPATAVSGDTVTCTASLTGTVSSGYWTVNGTRQTACDGQTSCTWTNVPLGTFNVQGFGIDTPTNMAISSNAVTVTIACAPVNGGWSAWSACSGGMMTQNCDSPAPACGGAACSGSGTQRCWEACDMSVNNGSQQVLSCMHECTVGVDCYGSFFLATCDSSYNIGFTNFSGVYFYYGTSFCTNRVGKSFYVSVCTETNYTNGVLVYSQPGCALGMPG